MGPQESGADGQDSSTEKKIEKKLSFMRITVIRDNPLTNDFKE